MATVLLRLHFLHAINIIYKIAGRSLASSNGPACSEVVLLAPASTLTALLFMHKVESSVSQNRIEQLALLRALVAFLGEKDQFGWWDCSFLGSTGRKYLAITHPRSHVATGLMAASEAARRVHDARIGKGRVYHLFRLPHATEQKLQRHVRTGDAAALISALKGKDKALQTLATLTQNPNGAPDGPIKLGGAKTLSSSTIIGQLAGMYLGAFRASQQTMPYFTATD